MKKNLLFTLSVLLALLATQKNTYAHIAIAHGCTSLLDSSDPLKSKQMYDRRYYYKHSMRYGYTLKESRATKDVSDYFGSFFLVEKLGNPALTKATFCQENITDLEQLLATSKSAIDIYAGNSSLDCLKILKETCIAQSPFFQDPIQIPFVKVTGLDKTLAEFIESEIRYGANIQALFQSHSLFDRILSTFNSRDLNARFNDLTSYLMRMLIESNQAIKISLKSGQDATTFERLENLAAFPAYFEKVKDDYRNYTLIYREFMKTADTYDSLSKEGLFLKKFNDILMSPVQRSMRYMMLLDAILKNLPTQDQGCPVEVRTLLDNSFLSAKGLATFVNQ